MRQYREVPSKAEALNWYRAQINSDVLREKHTCNFPDCNSKPAVTVSDPADPTDWGCSSENKVKSVIHVCIKHFYWVVRARAPEYSVEVPGKYDYPFILLIN